MLNVPILPEIGRFPINAIRYHIRLEWSGVANNNIRPIWWAYAQSPKTDFPMLLALMGFHLKILVNPPIHPDKDNNLSHSPSSHSFLALGGWRSFSRVDLYQWLRHRVCLITSGLVQLQIRLQLLATYLPSRLCYIAMPEPRKRWRHFVSHRICIPFQRN